MIKRNFTLFILLVLLVSLNSLAQTATTFTIGVQTTPAGCSKGSAKLNIQGGTLPLDITWSNGQTSTTVFGLDAGTYQVTIEDATLNDTIIYISIDSLICSLQPEITFSPNGDGINDKWDIGNIGIYDNYLVQVFTRWGQKVFESKNDYEPWDGTSFGSPVPDGTYYYIIEFNDKYFGEQNKHGSITILR